MNELVTTQHVSHPLLLAVLNTKRMNQMLGYPVIAPWDLEPDHDLEEWLEVADALSEIPSIRERKKAEQKIFDDARRSHPHYADLHRRH